jgi:lipopolysaccharide/colanic/teichoic acid biosynthesis glycosyltransferase
LAIFAGAWLVALYWTTRRDAGWSPLVLWIITWGVGTPADLTLLGTSSLAASCTLVIGATWFWLVGAMGAQPPRAMPLASGIGVLALTSLEDGDQDRPDRIVPSAVGTVGVPAGLKAPPANAPAPPPQADGLLWEGESHRREVRRAATAIERLPAIQRDSVHSFGLAAKRVVDVIGALVGIGALLPVLIVSAVLVRLSGAGPILYGQLRVGRGGRTFTCYKFRTMCVGADALQDQLRKHSVQDGPAFKIPLDPRVTRIGRFLRKFSLDELPQLLNVLLGDMSLVGPRPPIPTEVHRYTWWQRRRVSVKPGLTCVWQVWGRNRVTFKRWVEMDLFYIDNWSLWLDLKLMAHTFAVVLRGTGM